MNKKELSEAIAEGIDKSIHGQLIKGLIFGVASALVILFLIFAGTQIYDHYHPSQIGTVAQPNLCNSPHVTCTFYFLNGSKEIPYDEKQFCGFTEAEAYLKINNQSLYNQPMPQGFKFGGMEC